MNILLIDAGTDLEKKLSAWLPEEGRDWSVTQVHRLANALRLLKGVGGSNGSRIIPDLAILNLSLPDCAGPAGIARFKTTAPRVPVIALMTRLSARHEADALRLGAIDCLQRDRFDRNSFRTLLEKALSVSVSAFRSGEIEARVGSRLVRAPRANRTTNGTPDEQVPKEALDVLYHITPEGIVSDWSAEAERAYGLSAADVNGQHIRTLLPDELHGEVAELLQTLRSGSPILGRVARRLAQGGRIVAATFSAYPIYDATGSMMRLAFAEQLQLAPEPDSTSEVGAATEPGGDGSAATSTLEVAEQTMPEPGPELESKPHVLVVEDNAVSRRMMERMLEQTYRVTVAASPAEAITHAAGQVFDVLIFDINLQERRTGVELLHAIRKAPTYRKVPAVACTAYVLPGMSERLRELGFNGYISKPFVRQQLLDVVREVMQETSPADAPQRIVSEPVELMLPPAPTSLADAIDMLTGGGGDDIERLTGVLERDPVVASWVLQHVNSAFYGLRGNVSSVQRAVTLMGFEPICNLVLSKVLARAFAKFEVGKPARVYDFLQRTSVATAAYARALAEHLQLPEPELSFTAGLLHQLGRLGLLSMEPDKYAPLWFPEGCDDETVPVPPTVGQELLHVGSDHEALGVQIAREWQLPPKLALVIQRYDKPSSRAVTADAVLALTVSAGAAATRRLYSDAEPSDAEESTGPSLHDALKILARKYECSTSELEEFLHSNDAEVKELVQKIVLG